MGGTPPGAHNTITRRSTIAGRTTRHPGYALSQRARKRIEEVFGWIKTTGGLRKTRHRGRERVGWTFTFTAAAYNLVRIPKLLQAAVRCLLAITRCSDGGGSPRWRCGTRTSWI